LDAKKAELWALIPDLVYGVEEESLQSVIGDILIKQGKKFGTAESCTGGYISHLITSISGSSAYYNGGLVPYHNEFKHSLLQVDNSLFNTVGAVSKECVEQMALRTKAVFNSDYSIAVSGIAGPAGGTDEKPVGTVWISIATPEGIKSEKHIFGNNRERNIRMTAITALNLLRIELGH
jgi:nicotinamide-nucleotide amidase